MPPDPWPGAAGRNLAPVLAAALSLAVGGAGVLRPGLLSLPGADRPAALAAPCAAAALGASLARLTRPGRAAAGPPGAWLLLGIVGGLMLSQLVPPGTAGLDPALGRPCLALIGGGSVGLARRAALRLGLAVAFLPGAPPHGGRPPG